MVSVPPSGPAVVKLALVKPAVVNLQKAQNPWANVKCPFNQVCQNANCFPSFEMDSSYVMRYWYAYYLLFLYASFIYWFFAYTTNNLF